MLLPYSELLQQWLGFLGHKAIIRLWVGRFFVDVEVFSAGLGDTDGFLKLKEKKSCNNAAFHADIIHPLECGLNLACDAWLFITYLISFLQSFHINPFWFYFCSTWSLQLVFLWVVLFFNLVWCRYCPWWKCTINDIRRSIKPRAVNPFLPFPQQ